MENDLSTDLFGLDRIFLLFAILEYCVSYSEQFLKQLLQFLFDANSVLSSANVAMHIPRVVGESNPYLKVKCCLYSV